MDFFITCDKIIRMKEYDVIIIGAGAAGLSAAATAINRGRRVLVIEMGNRPARKVMASGGGRCNITNMAADYTRYFGKNPNFVRGALSRVSPQFIVEWAQRHNIALVEKAAGQLFCLNGADDVVRALMQDARGADILYDFNVQKVTHDGQMFIVNDMRAYSVIVATGGVSFGALGVSDVGYKIAQHFGHKIIPVRPALCALAIDGADANMAGISMMVEIKIGKNIVRDSLLITHFGIGGPAAYRASLYDINDGITINLVPDVDLAQAMKNAKRQDGKKSLGRILGKYLPNKVAARVVDNDVRNIADVKDSEIMQIANRVSKIWIPADKIKPHGMQSAEVVRGGVDTNQISSRTMESKLQPGLFWAGEVMDVAGDLGGFNLQWAWASGRVAGQNA